MTDGASIAERRRGVNGIGIIVIGLMTTVAGCRCARVLPRGVTLRAGDCQMGARQGIGRLRVMIEARRDPG